MEIWSAIGNLSPGVAVGALCVYFSNQNTVKYLDERKEALEALAAERKAWNELLEKLLDRYDVRSAAAIAAMTEIANQMHSLRGKTQEFWSGLELRLAAIEKAMYGESK